MSREQSPMFTGLSPDNCANTIGEGVAYLRNFGGHTCRYALLNAQPSLADADIVLPTITLGMSRHFTPHDEYQPPKRIEDIMHALDFTEEEVAPLHPDKSSHYQRRLTRSGALLLLMARVIADDMSDYPVVTAWGANLDSGTPLLRIDAAYPGEMTPGAMTEELAGARNLDVVDDRLTFAFKLPYWIDQGESVYEVGYGFDPLAGAAQRAELGL